MHAVTHYTDMYLAEWIKNLHKELQEQDHPPTFEQNRTLDQLREEATRRWLLIVSQRQ